MFCFLVVKSDLIYLSHAICPNLHGQLINWTSAFYLSFLLYGFTQNTEYISLWIGLFKLFVFLSYIYAFSYVILHHMVFVSILTTSRNFVKLISTFLLPVWDSQSPLSQDILVLCCTFKIIKTQNYCIRYSRNIILEYYPEFHWDFFRIYWEYLLGMFHEYSTNIYLSSGWCHVRIKNCKISTKKIWIPNTQERKHMHPHTHMHPRKLSLNS